MSAGKLSHHCQMSALQETHSATYHLHLVKKCEVTTESKIGISQEKPKAVECFCRGCWLDRISGSKSLQMNWFNFIPEFPSCTKLPVLAVLGQIMWSLRDVSWCPLGLTDKTLILCWNWDVRYTSRDKMTKYITQLCYLPCDSLKGPCQMKDLIPTLKFI